jgi:DNA (cytosine-5)-methyltransferase 1
MARPAPLQVVEICAGAGGQALGLEQAGYESVALVEIDPDACATLRANRPAWKVYEQDLRGFDGRPFTGVDMLAGGVPCPPFTKSGKQLGEADERDLFPEALRLAAQIRPRAIMWENVPGLADPKFAAYRARLLADLHWLGYRTWWQTITAADHGVPQLRPRFVLVGIRPEWAARFTWPARAAARPVTVGDALVGMMGARGWPGADAWRAGAQRVAPTLVGGSKKHGGPDLGPSQAKTCWRAMGVNPLGVADEPPGPDGLFRRGGGKTGDANRDGPMLTVPMAARIQGFPPAWVVTGGKTAAYRQVGNAFPPPVAAAVGAAIRAALDGTGPEHADPMQLF